MAANDPWDNPEGQELPDWQEGRVPPKSVGSPSSVKWYKFGYFLMRLVQFTLLLAIVPIFLWFLGMLLGFLWGSFTWGWEIGT